MSKTPFARIAITLPETELASADRLAKQQDRSRSWIIAEAIRLYAAAELQNAPDGLGVSRREQLRRDLTLTADARVREAEETQRLSERVSDPQHFATFDHFASLRRARDSAP